MRGQNRSPGAGVLAAAAPVMILCAVFLLCGICPLGDRFLLCDANADWFRQLSLLFSASGSHGGLFFSFSRALGSVTTASLANGLVSPFTLVAGFFPASMLPVAVSVITLLRASLGGLFAWMMMNGLSVEADGSRGGSLPAALLAAAYGAGSALSLSFLFPQYADLAVFLPLAGAGICRICSHGKVFAALCGMILSLVCAPTLWTLTLAFVLVFFAWRQAIESGTAKPHPLLERSAAGSIGFLLFCLAASFGAAAVVLVPVFANAAQLGDITVPVAAVDAARPFNALAGLLPAVRWFGSAENGAAVFPTAFTTTLAALLLPVYFFDSKRGLPERQIPVFAVLLTFLCICIPAMGWCFVCFAKPTGVAAGGGLVISLLSAGAASRLLSANGSTVMELPFDVPVPESIRRRFSGRTGSRVGSVLLSWVLLMLMAVGAMLSDAGWDAATLIVYIVLVTVMAAFAIAVLSGGEVKVGAFLLIFLAIVAESTWSGWAALSSDRMELTTVPQYTSERLRGESVRALIKADGKGREDSVYRLRAVRGADDAGLTGFDRIDAPGDMPAAARQLLAVLGVSEDMAGGYTPVTDALFGVRCVVGGQPGPSYAPLGAADGLEVYETRSALPAAFVSSRDILALTAYSADPFEAQNQLMTAAAGVERAVFARAAVSERLGAGCHVSDDGSVTDVIRTEEGAVVTYNITIPADGTLYMHIEPEDAAAAPKALHVIVGGRDLGEMPLGEPFVVGGFDRGATVNISLAVSCERLRLAGVWFATLDEVYANAALEELCARQSADAAVEEPGGNGLRVAASVAPGQLVVATVPFDSAWKVYVDNKPAEPVCAAGALLAADCGEGIHSVRFVYEPPELSASAAVSIGALLFCVVFAAAAAALRAKRERTVVALLDAAESRAFAPPPPPPPLPEEEEYVGFDEDGNYEYVDPEAGRFIERYGEAYADEFDDSTGYYIAPRAETQDFRLRVDTSVTQRAETAPPLPRGERLPAQGGRPDYLPELKTSPDVVSDEYGYIEEEDDFYD